jgi:hypothetical protein
MKLVCAAAWLILLAAGCGRGSSSAKPDAAAATNAAAGALVAGSPIAAAPATPHPAVVADVVRLAFPTNVEPYTVRVNLSPDARHFGCSYETERPLSQQDIDEMQKWLAGGRLSLRFMNSLHNHPKRGLMVVDGHRQFVMDGAGDGAFSADGRHFAYVAVNRERQTVTHGNQSHEEPVPADFVVLDGQPVSDPYYDFPAWGGPKLSADGKVWAAAAHRYSEAIARRNHQIVSFIPNQFVLLVNGVALAPVGESALWQGLPIAFSPAGHDYAFVGWTNPPNPGVRVFHNGEALGGYHGAAKPVFSRDGKHWGFLAFRGNDWLTGPNVLVVDGRENPLPPGEHVNEGRWLMGADDQHCLYFTDHENGGKMTWWWLGQQSRGYQYLDKPILSPDGRRMACVASIKNGRRMIVDGAEVGKESPSPGAPALFSPDSQHVAFISHFSAARKPQAAVVMDGVRGQPYSEIEQLTWSADSRHLAFIAKRDRWLLVTDAGEQPLDLADGRVDRLVFSADGKHAAAIVTFQSGQRTRWSADGHVSDDYTTVEDLAFSPDGQHLAAVVTERPRGGTSRDAVWKVVLDGVVQNEYDRVWPYLIPGQRPIQSLWWDDAGHVRYWALKGTNLLEVTQTVE